MADRAQKRSTVTITSRALWRIRLARELPRYLLCAMALAGLAASVRFVIAPVEGGAAATAVYQAAPPDLAAEAYAALFVRRYLTWNAAEPQAALHALEPFLGPALEPDAGLVLPPSGEQHVEWAEVVQAREPQPAEHVYTVAAETDDSGLLYLTVPVWRTAGGTLALGGYPAFVGAPAAGPAEAPAHLREVAEPALATVVQRVLHNYLAESSSELEADLTDSARVSLPDQPLSLVSMQHLDWAPGEGAVLATVQAEDRRGVQYTLAYELDVVREQGRWEVSAVQVDPDA
jgi:Conjugative transposon protein TcpC